jgi:hypothetical protein
MLQVVRGHRRPVGVSHFAGPARIERANEIDRSTVRVVEEERTQRSTHGIEAVGVVPQSEEDLLGHVVGFVHVIEDLAGEPIGGAAVTAIDLGESGFLVATNERHELRVTHLFQLIHGASDSRGYSESSAYWMTLSSMTSIPSPGQLAHL